VERRVRERDGERREGQDGVGYLVPVIDERGLCDIWSSVLAFEMSGPATAVGGGCSWNDPNLVCDTSLFLTHAVG
jgi:hypothetical protein